MRLGNILILMVVVIQNLKNVSIKIKNRMGEVINNNTLYSNINELNDLSLEIIARSNAEWSFKCPITIYINLFIIMLVKDNIKYIKKELINTWLSKYAHQ